MNGDGSNHGRLRRLAYNAIRGHLATVNLLGWRQRGRVANSVPISVRAQRATAIWSSLRLAGLLRGQRCPLEGNRENHMRGKRRAKQPFHVAVGGKTGRLCPTEGGCMMTCKDKHDAGFGKGAIAPPSTFLWQPAREVQEQFPEFSLSLLGCEDDRLILLLMCVGSAERRAVMNMPGKYRQHTGFAETRRSALLN